MSKRSHDNLGTETTRDARVVPPQADEPEPDLSHSEVDLEQLDLEKVTKIGDYRLCREIGRGGMGIVYEATELSLRRQVALKVLPIAAQLEPMLAQRFRNESRAAAQLNHPNIIPVYAVGASDGGNFFAMHLVEGRNLHQLIKDIRTELADASTRGHKNDATVPDSHASGKGSHREGKRKSSPSPKSDSPSDQRIELSASDFVTRSGRHFSTWRAAYAVARVGAKVADALQHAHDMGVIHRDIKPSNLMLDHQGKVWVTDFGLAHVKNTPSLTRTGMLLGTLRYMSPEQATGVRGLVDHRTDIYSLAVTLCELLTLQRLIVGKTTEEILRQIIYGAPVRIRRIDPAVPEDIAVILEKAMAKNPTERYATAGDMAEDLNRFLRNEAIKAKRPNTLKRCQRWLERHKAVASIIAAALVFVSITSLISTGAIWRALQAESIQSDRAIAALTESEALRFLANASLELNTDPGLSLALALEGATEKSQFEANRIVQAAFDAGHEYAHLQREQLLSTHVAISPDAQTAVTSASREIRQDGSYPALLHSMKDASVLRRLDSGDCITSAAYSPTGQYIVTASKAFADENGVAPLSRPPILWDAATGHKIRVFSGATLVQARSSIFQRGGQNLVLSHGNEAHVFDLAGGQPKVRLRGHSGPVVFAEFSPNGQRILTVSEDKTLRVWDSQTGRELRQPIHFQSQKVRGVTAQFVASSEALIVCENGMVQLHAAVESNTKTVPNKPLASANGFQFVASPAIDQVALFEGSRIIIRSAKNLELIGEIGFPTRVTDIRFHPTDATVLAICGKQMFLCNSETCEVLSELRGHQVSVTDACLAAGSDVLASVSSDRTVRLWHTQSGLERRTFQSPSDVDRGALPLQVAMSADDQSIAVGSRFESFSSLRDSAGKRLSSDALGMPSGGRSEREPLVLVRGNAVIVSEPSTSREIYRGAFSSTPTPETKLVDKGRRLFVHTRDFQAYLVDLDSGARRRLGDVGDPISEARVSADTSIAVLVAGDGRFFAIDTATGDVLWSRHHDLPIVDLDLSPDAETLALLDNAGNLLVWPIDEEKPSAFAKSGRPVNQVQFAVGGQRLITWDSLKNQAVRSYETQDLDTYVEHEVKGEVSVSVHATRPLVGIGSDKQAALWNLAEDSIRPLMDRSCRSICLLTDRAVMLLKPTATAPAALIIYAIEEDDVVYEETFDLAPVCVLPDVDPDRFVVTGVGYAANVFHFQTGKLESSSAAHASPIVLTGFSAAQRRLITVSGNGVALISDETGNVVHRIATEGQKITAVALDEIGEMLLLGSETGELTLCSIQDGSQVALGNHQAAVRSIRIDPSGKRAVTVADGQPVRYWDLRTHSFTEIKIPDATHAELHGERVLVIAGGPRSLPRKAWLVDGPQSKPQDITQADGTAMALFSPDGQRIGLMTPRGKLEVLRSQDLKVACTIWDPLNYVVRFAFAPDGKSVLTAETNTCTLWSIPEGHKILQVACSKSQIARLDRWTPFSHDGAWFVTADNEVRKVPRDPVQVARASAQRELSAEERRRFRWDLVEAAREAD